MFVYTWKHNDTPFYVGMTKAAGRTNPLNSGGRGWLCKQTLAKIGPKNVVIELRVVETIEEAQALERSLIEKYGRIQLSNGTLTNLRAGGDGSSGMTPAGRLATSIRMKENNPVFKPEVKEKLRLRMNEPDMKLKFSGENNPAKRPEVRKKLKDKWQDPEYREKQLARKLGKPIHSEEEKEKRRAKLLSKDNPMREYHKILNTDPGIKAKRVAALRDPERRKKHSETMKRIWAEKKGLI